MTEKTQECPRCGKTRLVDPNCTVLTPEEREKARDLVEALEEAGDAMEPAARLAIVFLLVRVMILERRVK